MNLSITSFLLIYVESSTINHSLVLLRRYAYLNNYKKYSHGIASSAKVYLLVWNFTHFPGYCIQVRNHVHLQSVD